MSDLEDIALALSRRGKPGDVGPQGPKGEPGPPGPKGDRGPQGIDGLLGPRGLMGVPGLDGQDGVRGDPGKPGANGERGLRGLKGERGLKGDKGEPGEKGEKGEGGGDGSGTRWIGFTGVDANDHGSELGTIQKLDFLGAGVTVAKVGRTAEITIPGITVDVPTYIQDTDPALPPPAKYLWVDTNTDFLWYNDGQVI